MEFLDLFVVALMPVIKLLLLIAVGLFLAIDRVNILGPQARHSLNNIVFYVFSPAMVGSYLAETITLTTLAEMWFMPLNILITFIIGSALGRILVKITATPPHLQSLVIGSCAAGNLGNLMLILIPAVCKEKNSPFGETTVCTSYGDAYASASMAIGSIYIWSYVYMIMRVPANKSIEEINANDSTSSIKSTGETSEIFSQSCTESLLPLKDCPSSEKYLNQVIELPDTTISEGNAKVPILEKIKQHIEIFTRKIHLKMVFAPSTIGAIVGFVIGIISPIRKAMIGDDAPLRVIESSAYLLGEAAIPSMTLILGANLLRGLKRSEVGWLLILGILAVRYIVLPLLGIVIVKAAHHFGMVGSHSLYQFILMLQYALPPAMSVGTMTELFEAGESECSVIMLWTYAVASISLTFWSTCFMWLVA